MFRILLVDNDITHANLTARGIQDLRFGVTTKYALSGAQGLLYLAGTRAAKKSFPEMIIMCADLPDADGMDVFRTLSEAVSHEAIPILVVSKSTDRKLASQYYKAGATAYVPYSEDVESYMRAVSDSVAFVAMMSGLVPRQDKFFPAESQTELKLGDILQVHL
ncbi:MAG: response regulator [Planctomycetes bacterium]|nr:response regulator [Planctomycetota bacterium]